MKRIILSESEKQNILSNYNLLIEGISEDQQSMMKFKNDFMSKSYGEIADGLEKMKSAPGLTSDDISQIDQAVLYLRKNNALSGTAKQMVNKKFDEYINDRPEVAKNMLCYLINKNPEYSNPEMKSFCDGGSKSKEITKNIEDTIKKSIDNNKIEEPKKVEIKKSNNSGSFMNPYSSGSNTLPGSFMNPYGS